MRMGVLEKILALMDFLERNFEKVISYAYCDESYLMVDEYIEKKRRENPDGFRKFACCDSCIS